MSWIRRKAIVVWLAAAIAVAAGAAAWIGGGPVAGETAVLRWVNGWPGSFDGAIDGVMFFGTLAGAAVAAVGVGVAVRRALPGLVVAGAAAVARLASDGLKEIVTRPRPSASQLAEVRDHVSGYGWPSTHAAISAAVATVAVAVLPRRLRPVAVALAVVVAAGRLYAGVHFPLDVIGGAAIGVLVGSAATALVPYRSAPRAGS